MELKYFEFMTVDGTCYRINKENIVEFDMAIKQDFVDFSLFGENNSQKLTPLLESLLLVIDDYHNIKSIGMDKIEEYEPDDTSISYINLIYENGESKSCFVDMSDEDYNRNQLNSLKDNMLFISIEDNKDKFF